jgi:uncharacterized protein YmfQ (DUF2313 family)
MFANALFAASDYLNALLRLLPRGMAWSRDPDCVRTQALAGCAPTFSRVNAAAVALLVDAFPATAVGLLPEWEAALGLPDPCLGPNPTIAQRQASVVARLANSGGQSVPFFIALALTLGFVITITEFAGSAALANTWRVNVLNIDAFRLKAGDAAGEFLSVIPSAVDVLECEFKRLAPAHTILEWNIE